MEHLKKHDNQLLSAKGDLIILGLAAISLFLLNWQIEMKFVQIISGAILILISGYGLSMVFFPKINDLNLLNRLILAPIFGIFFTGLWSIILNYTPYHNNSIYYELGVIPVLILILVMRLFQFLKTGANFRSSDRGKSEENTKKELESDHVLTTAQIAAKAEKAKLNQINERNNRSLAFKNPELPKESSPQTNGKIPYPMPRPSPGKKHSSKKTYKNTLSKSKKIENNKSNTQSKPKWAFKSHETSTNSRPAPEKIEIVKIRKSSRDLMIILFVIILSALFIFLPYLKTSLIKIPFVITLIFFIPGYSTLSGIFINYADHGLFKKLFSSVLLSITTVIGLLLVFTLLNIQLSSSFILAALLVISTLMSILGYLRRVKSQSKVKKEFISERSEISEKKELNVLTVSQARESTKDNLFQNSSENSLLQENNDPAILKDKDNGFSNKTENKNPESVLSPSEARKRVMSRKKARENLQKENSKINSMANAKASTSSGVFNADNIQNIEKLEKSVEYSKGLSLFKLIVVIFLSVLGLVLTIINMNSLIPSSSGIISLNSELIKLVFIIPILLYLPGYAMKELFIPYKYSGIVFNTAICVVVSLSLDIIIAFALLYLGDLFNQINITQSLYVGILSFISISGIIIGYWQSNYRNKNKISAGKSFKYSKDSVSKDSNYKDSESVSHQKISKTNKFWKKREIKETGIKSTPQINKDKELTTKNIEDSEKISLNENIIAAPEKAGSDKNQTSIIPEKKSFRIHGKKPLKTMYMEEELERSFPSSDYFKEDLSNNSKNISSKSPYLSPKKSNMALDLLIILIITFLTITSIYLPIISQTPIREISGIIFVIFIPGYVLIAALFPKKHDLNIIERLALSIGLSVAISPLIGLALNYTPFGIKLTPIVVALTGFTIIMLIIAYIQRRRIAEDNRFQPNFSRYFYSLKKSFDKESRMDKVLSIILILILVLAIATTTYIIVKPKEGEKFTEFYILGPDGKASDYPTNLTLGQSGKIFVGVVNREYSTVNYEMVVKLQGKILSSEKMTLKNNQKWEKAVIFTPDQSGSKQKLELILYKLPDNKKPYRSLHLWVNVV